MSFITSNTPVDKCFAVFALKQFLSDNFFRFFSLLFTSTLVDLANMTLINNEQAERSFKMSAEMRVALCSRCD